MWKSCWTKLIGYVFSLSALSWVHTRCIIEITYRPPGFAAWQMAGRYPTYPNGETPQRGICAYFLRASALGKYLVPRDNNPGIPSTSCDNYYVPSLYHTCLHMTW
jgi:hypothetical protein